MKRILLSSIALFALASPVFSQAVVTTPAPSASVSITVAPEQRTRIKEYVVKEKVRLVTVKERVTAGATLPADVELVEVPADWGPDMRRYGYIYSGNNVVLVEPSSRRVVHVID